MDHVLSKPCCKGTILKRNYRKMTLKWSVSYINPFVKFQGHFPIIITLQDSKVIKNGSHIITMLYQNPFCKAVGCSGTALYIA